MKHSSWINSLLDLVYPRLCLMCGQRLMSNEQHVCTSCLTLLPRTNFHQTEENMVEKLFRGIVPIERCAILFFYQKGNSSCNIVHHLKYHMGHDTGIYFGRLFATEIASSGFFNDIDLLIPVPLSKHRLHERGYNQAEMIAIGVSQATGIPIDTLHLTRVHNNPTQTRQSRTERLHNTEHLFTTLKPEELAQKHVLLIDDVITTGSTLRACACALLSVAGIRFSILTLGCTQA